MALSHEIARTLQHPTWLAHRYDAANDAFQFRQVARERHAELPFLTDQHLGVEPSPLVIAAADVAAMQSSASPAPIHFIFHSAYCASTMLVRLFDLPGRAMGLSEPQLLNDMVGWRRRGANVADHARGMALSLALLGRPFGSGEAVVVKPSNIVNPLAAGMLTLSPASRALFLYAPLADFLLSVARKGLWCRLWCRELLEGYLQEGFVDLGFVARDYFRQSDLQVAAVGWLAQQANFARLAERFGDRITVLDSRELTRNPATSAATLAAHFGIAGLSERDFAAHPALSRDSKTGAYFAPGQRDIDLTSASSAYGDEIEQIVGWAEAVANTAGVPLSLHAG